MDNDDNKKKDIVGENHTQHLVCKVRCALFEAEIAESNRKISI